MKWHMSGPWKFGKRSKYYQHISSDQHDPHTGMSCWYDFCRVVVRMEDAIAGDPSEKVGMANARLICAAPDLLEALIHLADVASGCDSWESFPRMPLEKAYAAIAKATGSAS